MCYHTHNHAGVAGLQIMLINFHLTSKESRAQSNYLFSNSISAALSDQFMIVKSVGEHQPSLSPSPKIFVRFSLPPGISMSGLEKISIIIRQQQKVSPQKSKSPPSFHHDVSVE